MENLAEKRRLALNKIRSDFLAEHPNASLSNPVVPSEGFDEID